MHSAGIHEYECCVTVRQKPRPSPPPQNSRPREVFMRIYRVPAEDKVVDVSLGFHLYGCVHIPEKLQVRHKSLHKGKSRPMYKDSA